MKKFKVAREHEGARNVTWRIFHIVALASDLNKCYPRKIFVSFADIYRDEYIRFESLSKHGISNHVYFYKTFHRSTYSYVYATRNKCTRNYIR